jgi:hypothetical protein
MNKIKNITVVISRDDFYRNFFKSKAFTDLEEKFDVSYVLEFLLPKDNKKKISYFKKSSIKESGKYTYRAVLLMLMNRHMSKSYDWRISRLFHPLNFHYKQIPNFKKMSAQIKIKKILFYSIKVIINKFKYLKAIFLSQKIIYKIFSNKFYFVTYSNRSLESAILDNTPDLVILPFGAQEIELPQIVDICKKNQIKSYAIIDAWDNLSSKSIIEDKPDFLGVWSEQAKNHAIEIQNFNSENIFLLGSPRFDIIYEKREKKTQSQYNFEYVLFLGLLFDWNEELALEILDDEISSRKDIYFNTKIIYRPHPRRNSRLRSNKNFINIIIDEDLKKPGTSLPSLDNYSNNIMNSLFVMGALTTGLLESIAFYKKYMLLCYNDEYDFYSQGSLLTKYKHLENLKQIEDIEFCDEKENIALTFRKLFQQKKDIDKLKIDKQRDYFITGNIKNSFSKNLTKSILELY